MVEKYRPEAYAPDDATQARFAAGNEVGDLAMGLFGDFVEVTSFQADGSLDLRKMKALTRQYLAEGKKVICEAAFDYRGLYCAVDILRRSPFGYDIYEVKSSTSPDHDVYLVDTAYQKYVLEKCGVKVGDVFIVTLDPTYVFDGTLELSRLFKITEITDFVRDTADMVAADLAEAERVMGLLNEPDIPISPRCNKPYRCACFDYCTRDLPSPSVFDLYHMNFAKGTELCGQGIVSFEDVRANGIKLSAIAERQLRSKLENLPPYIDREGIGEFLKQLTYPLYFLDFETVQPAVPRYIGTRPYQQIPVQYSLHILQKDGTLEHREFLGRSEEDPRRALAEKLTADIPEDVCVLAYNKTFECGRIGELAEAFPDLAEHLLCIKENIVDLLVPFRKGYYYTRDMGGSFSIKSVLPALYPDDPALDYHNLEGVHNGSEAMDLFPRLKDMPEKERAKAEEDLLRYCELDTFAMVKVYEALLRAS